MNTLLNTSVQSSDSISVSTIILAVFAVLVIFGALKGLFRGIKRQIVRTITVAASIFIAVATVTGIDMTVGADLAGMTVGDMVSAADLSSLGEYEALVSGIDARLVQLVATVPMAVIALPIIFVLAFVVISAIGEVVHIILSFLLGFKSRRNNLITRLLGGVLGALQGAVVAGIILFPIGCVTTLADGMVSAMGEGGIKQGTDIETVYELLDTEITEAKDNIIIKTTMSLGGSALQDKISVINIDGEEMDTREMFYTIMGIVGDSSYLNETEFKAPTAEEQKVINGIKDKLVNDDYMAEILSGLLREMAIALKEGRLEVNMEEPYGGMIKEAIAIFETSSKSNLDGDVSTLLDVYYTLADNGVLIAMNENPDGVTDALAAKTDGDETVIMSVIGILKNYDRTNPLVSMLAKLSVSIMAENLGLEGEAAETYDSIKDGISDVLEIDKSLSDEEYKAEVADTLNATLAENGITLDEQIVDGMADYVTKELKNNTELTDENIDDVLFSYYDAYLKSQQAQ